MCESKICGFFENHDVSHITHIMVCYPYSYVVVFEYAVVVCDIMYVHAVCACGDGSNPVE